MCGIAGIVSSNLKNKGTVLKQMTDAILHRGPDGEGQKVFSECILGHRRLSIVDLKTGDQPMLNLEKNVGLVFNGEIYGYKDIKKLLSSFKFQTESDTEVILALYETYGRNFLHQLPGMFAFALWDEKERTLIAARDRFGEKPLYYTISRNGDFLFASEIKALLASGLIEPILNKNALAYYLTKLYVHPTETIYENIHTLPPGHMLVYKNNQLNISRYWNIPQTKDSGSMDETIQEFREKLTSAVQKQLVADVPVGAFLSGGLDSSTIVGIATTFKPDLKTFAFGFEGTKNELPFAKEAAQKFGTNHYELHDTDFKIADLILKMAAIYDEPFADSSNIPTYLISQKTREYTKVVLTGDGGDELLGGYGWYKSLLGSDWNKDILTSKVFFFKALAHIAMRRNFKNKVKYISKARSLHNSKYHSSVLDAHQESNIYFTSKELKQLGLSHNTSLFPISFNQENTVNDAMKEDVENYMPGDILVKIDRASMANSLELRSPFLDVPFSEFVLSLPHNFKVNNLEDKILLRRAFESTWPDSIKKRGKLGFGAPIKIWLQKPEVKDLVHEYLNDPHKKIFTYLSFPESRKYISGGNYKLWILLTLSVWMETHTFK